jgi:hypothetical protein
MGMTRIWNVTDDPSTDVVAQKVVVLGKEIMPGRFIQVDEAVLEHAHKLKVEIEQKHVYIGKNPPAQYASVKKPAKAGLNPLIARSHGEVPMEAIKAAAPAVVEEKMAETPAVEGTSKKKNRQWSSGQ